MNTTNDDFGFAPPAFKPAEALTLLKRGLRDSRPLTERGDGFDLKGARVLELALDGETIAAKLAKRPMRGGSAEWDTFKLANSAEVRKFSDEVKKRVARWTEEDRS